MRTFRWVLFSGFVSLFVVPAFAAAASDDEIDDLRTEIEQLRADYEARIRALEERLSSAEENAEQAQADAVAAQQTAQSAASMATTMPAATSAPAPGGGGGGNSNVFNPAISLILQGSYSAFSADPGERFIPGVLTGGEAAEGAGIGAEGFSLGETELDFSANVDDKFYAFTSIALGQDGTETEVSLEEAYLKTLALPTGLGLKAGQFYSGIGYQNSIHSHAWDFIDAPLAYQGLLGIQYIDPGVQATWLAPTPFYLRIGGELLAGNHFPASGGGNDGAGAQTVFVDFGSDIGASHSWQAGLSYLSADVNGRESSFGDDVAVFDGDSDVFIADLVWKWAPNGNYRNRNFKFQAEYLRREEDGVIGLDSGRDSEYHGEQSGWYAQGVYQFMPQWRVGLRYDRMAIDNRIPDFPADMRNALFFADTGRNPWRTSAMVDFSNSEFSRLRLQYNHENLDGNDDDQVFLQYIMSLGAHGAHGF